MRVCDGITYMVIGEAPDLSSVDEEIWHRWNSLSIETARREAQRQTQHPLGPKATKFPKSFKLVLVGGEVALQAIDVQPSLQDLLGWVTRQLITHLEAEGPDPFIERQTLDLEKFEVQLRVFVEAILEDPLHILQI